MQTAVIAGADVFVCPACSGVLSRQMIVRFLTSGSKIILVSGEGKVYPDICRGSLQQSH